MTPLTVKELNKVINKWIDDDEDDCRMDYLHEFFQSEDGEKLKINKDVTFKLIESKRLGGEEGDSDVFMVVFLLVATGQLFRIDGYYCSWEGTSFDNGEFYEVEREAKVIYVYNKKKKPKAPKAKSRLAADLKIDPV